MKVRHAAFLAVLGMMSTGPMPAVAAAPPEPVSWTLAIEPAAATLKAGATLTAVVSAKLEPGWHVYGTQELPDGPRPLRVALTPPSRFVAKGALVCPEPERDMDEGFGQVTAFYRSEVTCKQIVGAAPSTKPGSHTLSIDISFQACDGKMCLPARLVRLTKPVTLTK